MALFYISGNVILKIDTQYDTYKRNDETYFKTKKLDLKIVDMRDRQLHYSNLFGNALLGIFIVQA